MSGKLTNIKHGLTLVRAGNIIIIAATMCIVKFLVFEQWIKKTFEDVFHESFLKSDLVDKQYELNFWLLVIAVCSIAAAGNIINDYFDVKADRVNRPDTIVIGKHIKRRWAIVIHWGLNILGISIAVYLSWYYKNWWLLVIPIISSTLLWIYSTQLKRRLLIGNLTIALLTALVIIITALLMIQEWPKTFNIIHKIGSFNLKPPLFLSCLLAGFAALCNFTREIVKDLHDVEGDKAVGRKTIPIEFGTHTTKLIIGVLLFFQLAFFLLLMLSASSKLQDVDFNLFPLIIGILLISLYSAAFIINLSAKNNKQHYWISNLLKLVMLVGLSFPFVLLL